MMGLIRAFEAKLWVFRNDIMTKNNMYFPNLKKNIKDLDAQEKGNKEKVIDDFISVMDFLIKEFSARFSQFKELSETFKFIMYPDVISFDKLNLSQFHWLEIEELEMQLIDFQSSSIWIQKFIETRKKLKLIEAERLTSNISKNTIESELELISRLKHCRRPQYPNRQGMESWQACLEFEPSATKDPPSRGAMHVKSVEAQTSTRWCGVVIRRGGSSSGVVFVT
ncbi:dimer_Tnp_hAT domain-containing protein [Trichonephila clavipes]|nr:dimer_Tnp_hAT domain-containing protein [Trichonephila clavipes]